jgi:hypothetical protein
VPSGAQGVGQPLHAKKDGSQYCCRQLTQVGLEGELVHCDKQFWIKQSAPAP